MPPEIATIAAPPSEDQLTIRPSVLHVGTPIALVTTQNPDGTANISPLSSTWALADRAVLGLTAIRSSRRGFSTYMRTPGIVIPGTNHIDCRKWGPLLTVFRHYFGQGPDLGRTFKAAA